VLIARLQMPTLIVGFSPLPALTFVLIFILVFSFLEKLIAAMAAALLVKSPNRAGYCYRMNIFFQRMEFRLAQVW
jgi:hypothetical protein